MRHRFLICVSFIPFVLALAGSGNVGSAPTAVPAAARATSAEPSGSGVVPNLSDLVGVRGSAAEAQMQARGYTAVGGEADGAAKVTYWRLARDGSCISVRTADGRYEAIAPATREDCERAEKATQGVAKPDAGGFRTVCGVMVEGKPVRYVCSVVGGDQHSTPTTLRFPDLEMVLKWQAGKSVSVEMQGSVPIAGTWSDSEGETDIVTPEKTWFYVSNRQAAALEVQSLENRASPAQAAAAAGPSFSCDGVEAGSIEDTICKDPELSALDLKLSDVYAAAVKKATNEHPPVLKAEQRGWVKGRDECWKSDDKRACLMEAYTRRIAELQAKYRLVTFTGPVFFACDGNPANEVVVTFFETEPPTLIAERGDSVSLMYRQRSGSGAKYQGGNETFWEHQGEAMVTWGYGAKEMRCQRRGR